MLFKLTEVPLLLRNASLGRCTVGFALENSGVNWGDTTLRTSEQSAPNRVERRSEVQEQNVKNSRGEPNFSESLKRNIY